MVMRGGTSKGLYFLASDLPSDQEALRRVLLAAMGSPDPRQIDGMGGAHPLTSKVAVVSPSSDADADVDYHFWQVFVDRAEVSDSQNCGNILAGVAPFAIEQGLVQANGNPTSVRIRMSNTGSLTIASVPTRDGCVDYRGDARIDGVPGTSAPIVLDFRDIAGSSCGAMLPTGNVVDNIGDYQVTCIDNGMPVVLVRADSVGKTGLETPEELEADRELKKTIEGIRLAAGPLMGLGDVAKKTVPKMCLVSAPQQGGLIATRTFIPHRVHEAIGVLGAVSVATACVIEGTVAQQIVSLRVEPGSHKIDVEHPTGFFTVQIAFDTDDEANVRVTQSALLRTARKIMSGTLYIPSDVWMSGND